MRQATLDAPSQRSLLPLSMTEPSISLDHIFMGISSILVAVFSVSFLHTYHAIQLNSAFWALEAVFLAAFICAILVHRMSSLVVTFYVVFWIFTFSRPAIELLIKGWHPFSITETPKFQLMILFVSIVSFFAATVLSALFIKPKTQQEKLVATERIKNSEITKQVQVVSLILFFICYIFMLYISIKKLIYMHDKNYLEYFREYVEDAPVFVRTMATFCPFILCMFLATFPKKKITYIVLILYSFANIPLLVFGLRGRFAFSLIFCLIYFLLRDRMGDDEKWIGKFEKTLIVVGIPVLMLLFDIMNYARAGVISSENSTVMKLIDFVFKQGVTYDVIGIAHDGMNTMRVYGEGHHYTFGPFIDYFRNGPFASILLDLKTIPENNSVEMATTMNNFSHLLSYSTHPNYLGGEGYGSSYMLEVYFDYSWVGLALFNGGLGVMLMALPALMKRYRWIFFIGLISLTEFYWIVRDSAFGWFRFVVTPQFWAAVVLIVLGVTVLNYLSKTNFKLGDTSKKLHVKHVARCD